MYFVLYTHLPPYFFSLALVNILFIIDTISVYLYTLYMKSDTKTDIKFFISLHNHFLGACAFSGS